MERARHKANFALKKLWAQYSAVFMNIDNQNTSNIHTCNILLNIVWNLKICGRILMALYRKLLNIDFMHEKKSQSIQSVLSYTEISQELDKFNKLLLPQKLKKINFKQYARVQHPYKHLVICECCWIKHIIHVSTTLYKQSNSA